jgi:Male germ-cell putative homeodomain transcription factor
LTLVSGSTFPKEKSQFPWTFFTGDSISHVIFLPLRSQWWIEQTTEPVFYLLTALYFLQIFSLITWVSSLSLASPTEEWISASETLTPLMLMFIVSEILTQAKRHDEISATHAFESVSDDASVDFDDLASLSDRSCRSSSPGDGASLDRGHVFSFPGQVST